jgi:hypothetical protein
MRYQNLELSEIETIVTEIEQEKEAGELWLQCNLVCDTDAMHRRGGEEAFKAGCDCSRTSCDDLKGSDSRRGPSAIVTVIPLVCNTSTPSIDVAGSRHVILLVYVHINLKSEILCLNDFYQNYSQSHFTQACRLLRNSFCHFRNAQKFSLGFVGSFHERKRFRFGQ